MEEACGAVFLAAFVFLFGCVLMCVVLVPVIVYYVKVRPRIRQDCIDYWADVEEAKERVRRGRRRTGRSNTNSAEG